MHGKEWCTGGKIVRVLFGRGLRREAARDAAFGCHGGGFAASFGLGNGNWRFSGWIGISTEGAQEMQKGETLLAALRLRWGKDRGARKIGGGGGENLPGA